MNTRIMGIVPIAVLLAFAGCNNQKQQTATADTPAVVQAAAPVPKQPTPAAPDQPQSQPQLKGEARTDVLDASTVPDPAPPVPVEQIEGSWWLTTQRPFKTYVFIEKIFYDKGLTEVSFRDGRVMLLSCRLGGAWLAHPEKHPRDYVDDWNRNHSWQTCAALPLHTWTRIAVSKELFQRGKDASYDVWGVEFYPYAESDLIYSMSVEAICDDLVSETCKTAKVAFDEWEANDAARRRVGGKSAGGRQANE